MTDMQTQSGQRTSRHTSNALGTYSAGISDGLHINVDSWIDELPASEHLEVGYINGGYVTRSAKTIAHRIARTQPAWAEDAESGYWQRLSAYGKLSDVEQQYKVLLDTSDPSQLGDEVSQLVFQAVRNNIYGRRFRAAQSAIPHFPAQVEELTKQITTLYASDRAHAIDRLIALLEDNTYKTEWPYLVILCESLDTGLPEQSLRLTDRLLGYSQATLESNLTNDADAVRSAIRTVASIISINNLSELAVFLDPPHMIDTRLTTLMSIVNIMRVESCPNDKSVLAKLIRGIHGIASSCLHDHVVANAEMAAIVSNALAALAALGENPAKQLQSQIEETSSPLFRAVAIQRLKSLDSDWSLQGLRPETSHLRSLIELLS